MIRFGRKLCAGDIFRVAFLAVCLTSLVFGQVTTGDIVGTVTDASGAVVANATVTLTNVATQETRSLTTSGVGDYSFNLVKPGHYKVHIEAKGFQAYDVADVLVSTSSRGRVDAQLAVGNATETVVVTGETVALQTDSSTVQDVVGEHAVQNLPLNGRNVVGLIQVTAGVNPGVPNAISSGNRPDDRRPGFTISANGQSDLLNNVLVDGLDNNEREQGLSGIRPSIEGIAEVRVMTNDYSAEVGHSAGAVVNIITKSGGNDYHGSAYEYFRNDVLNSRDFFAPSKKPKYRQNIFGGSAGGPIKKDRTFFFGDVEWNRSIQGVVRTSTVPTLFEQQHPGDFTDIGGPSLAALGVPVNPVALNFFKLYPAPNKPGSRDNFVSAPTKTQFATVADGRIDHRFGDNDSIFGRYSINPVTTVIPGKLPAVNMFGKSVEPGGDLLLFAGPSKTQAQNLQVDYIHIFNANTAMNLKAGYTRINIQTQPLNYGTNLGSQFGLVNSNITPTGSALAPMWFLTNDYASVGDGVFLPISDVNNTFQYNGSINYNRGRHSIKTGAALIRRQLNYGQDVWAPQGGFAFVPGGKYGVSMANFLAGEPFFGLRGNQLNTQSLRSWEPSIYIQDDWRATNWLTINLGLRWDTSTPVSDAHNIFANFDPAQKKLLVAGVNTTSTGGIRTDYKDFAPRIGFAATFAKNTVVRGGYGITYYPVMYTAQLNNQNPPFSYVCFPCFGVQFPILPRPTAPSATNPSGNLNGEDLGLTQGHIHQFNLFVQKQVGANTFTLGGVGSLGRSLAYSTDLTRPLPPGPGKTATPLYATELPNVTGIGFTDNRGISNYYAMQASFTRNLTKGLGANANYTWGHGLGDNASSSTSSGPPRGLFPTNPLYDYGNSDIDIRHRIAISITYELPFGKGLNGPAKVLAQGWQLSSIAFWQTGIPFTVINDSAPQIGIPGVRSDRPNQIASASIANPGINKWFNTAAFVPQVAGTPGNEGVNQLYGPHARSVNLAAMKDFAVWETLKLQFRAECFNISNTPSFALPNNSLGPALGTISATADNMSPRQFQFALKLLF